MSKYTFHYEGLDRNGSIVKNQIDANSLTEAKNDLILKEIIVTNIKKETTPFYKRPKQIKPADIAYLTRQTSTLLNAGLPVVRTFEIMMESTEHSAIRKLLSDIKMNVSNGMELSIAFSKHPKYFDEFYCGLIQAGETSGTLDIMMGRLADHMEKTEALKKKIKKAMTYPIAVMVVAFIVTMILLVKVIPVFEEMFQSFGADLPAFTQMVVNMSDTVQKTWYLIIAGLVGVFFIISNIYKKTKKGRKIIDTLVLKIPLFGTILKESMVARFCRVLSTTFASGVTLIEGLGSVEKSITNTVYKETINPMINQIKEGVSINQAIKQAKIYPPELYHMVSIGEESGSIDEMLSKVADIFEASINDKVDNMTTLMEPIIMATLGVILGGLIIAMYLPLFAAGGVF